MASSPLWNKRDEYIYEIPKGTREGMNVPGVIFGSEEIVRQAESDKALEQVINVATLPGILNYSMAMPDIHWGYGFPIGGVAAFDIDNGVITPGGIGFDINCGVRLLSTPMDEEELRPKLLSLLNALFMEVPSGVGSQGFLKLRGKELNGVLEKGAMWAVENGFGYDSDLSGIESQGHMDGADSEKVSSKAKERGSDQLGTLGSGNHFLEVQVVRHIYDQTIAEQWGLHVNQVVIMLHTGSRGLGHQVATDYIDVMLRASKKYGIKLVDKQLAAAPFKSEEGQNYWSAMQCASNYAWANRQIITHYVRNALNKVFGKDVGEQTRVVYDVAHNIAKVEKHQVREGLNLDVLVHRKGATRSFPAGHDALAGVFKETGQPVIIPGSMGTSSYLLVGMRKSMEMSFGSTCHGAGRVMSRKEAVRRGDYNVLISHLNEQGILLKSTDRETALEEAPEAYKNVDEVVDVVEKVGLNKKVAQMCPMGVVKG
ncbi:RtcB family protein [Coprothermobacter platensis]|uniref:RtcB family protein n=1 Tax=Coprothermobacter platensis TaxID=108819 RepID=UPI00037DBBEB|nr:RtcB family protein [Coprothermobacter platensis]